MNYIMKYLVYVVHNELKIKESSVSICVPINRFLDVVSNCNIDTLTIDDRRYLYVYLPHEEFEPKTKVLVLRIIDNTIMDMTEEDKPYMHKLSDALNMIKK